MVKIIDEVKGLYKIIEFKAFRKTPGVTFDIIPMEHFPHIDSIDRVIHITNAISPGPVNNIARPWYMHEYQEDNLAVLHGLRNIELYNPSHGKIEHFRVAPTSIHKNGKLIASGGVMLVWPCGVFHRIISGENGSGSINFAVHNIGFDIKTNFSIYDVDIDSGNYHVIREGFKDQV